MIPALLLSLMAAVGVTLALREIVPGPPQLYAALNRMDQSALATPNRRRRRNLADLVDHVGTWTSQRIAAGDSRTGRLIGRLLLPDAADLAILDKELPNVLGSQIIGGLMGLAGGGIVAVGTSAITDGSIPPHIVLGVTVAAGFLCFILPAGDIRSKATDERIEFTRNAAAYIDLVAISRIGGADPVTAMQGSARISGHRHFRRISQLLSYAEWDGTKPWTALQDEGRRIRVSALTEVGDILRLAGDAHAQIYDTLRARAAALRSTQLAQEKEIAKKETVKLLGPQLMVGMVFVAAIFYPMITRLAGGGLP